MQNERQTRHFINLTNGIERIPDLRAAGVEYAYLRIQSTACEQKRWDALIAELDSNFLMSLALGYHCIVYDYSNKRETPRAIWQGLEFVKFCLARVWFERDYPVASKLRPHFEQVWRNLSQPAKNKLRYFARFLLTDTLALTAVTARTNHDGQRAYYRGIMEQMHGTDKPSLLAERAMTSAQKREIIERLLRLWEASPSLRLGQLLINGLGTDFYLTEDYDLIDALEAGQKETNGLNTNALLDRPRNPNLSRVERKS